MIQGMPTPWPWVLLVAVAAGCQAPQAPKDPVVRLVPAPALTCKPEPRYRWLDALGQPYSQAFRKSFSYENAEVDVRFDHTAPVFEGTIQARKLKPNFAYQIKLVGMPPTLWGEEGDADANRRIGEVGRWWVPGKDGHNAYFFDNEEDKGRMEGYLVLGYFVTDAEGQADVAFRADSSFHVLWKTDQWPPSEGDAPPTHHEVVAQAGSYGYDRTFDTASFGLYAEQQYGRPPIGKAFLSAGPYTCFFLLTEESFHDYYNDDGGDWAAALAQRIEFVIADPPKPATATFPAAPPE